MYREDLDFVNIIHPDVIGIGVSPENTQVPVTSGSPYGGLALYGKSLAYAVKPVDLGDTRLQAVRVELDGNKKLDTVNVYLPCEASDNYDEQIQCSVKIQGYIEDSKTPNVFVVGDYNANLARPSHFGQELLQLCSAQGLVVCDKDLSVGDEYTYVSESPGTTSWLDDCICTSSAFNNVTGFKVFHDTVCSDQIPMLFTVKCSYIHVLNDATNSDSVHKGFIWDKLDKDGILKYCSVLGSTQRPSTDLLAVVEGNAMMVQVLV